jgi:hypothetical protein
MEMQIPFIGNALSFSFSPSSAQLISKDYSIHNGELVVVFSDNENLDANVNTFVEQVIQNLENLSKDMENFKKELVQELSYRISKRVNEIISDKNRHNALSFPVIR